MRSVGEKEEPKPLRVGIVGLGRWGLKALREWAMLVSFERVKPVAIYDPDPERVDDAVAMDAPHIRFRAPSYDALLSEVDAVHICSPNEHHFNQAAAALQLGKHVLVEKPVTMTEASARVLVASAARRKLVLMPGHLYRGDDVVNHAKKLALPSEIGPPLYATARWTAHHPPPNQHGVVWDLLPHPVDLLNHLWGEWPRSFMGVAKYGSAELVADYQDKHASFELSWRNRDRRRELVLVHTEATIIMDLARQTVTVDGVNGRTTKHLYTNTIRSELNRFIDACNGSGEADWSAESAIGCVRSVALANQAVNH